MHEPLLSKLPQQIGVAKDAGPFRDEPDRMARFEEHLEQVAGNAEFDLGGLVGVGVGAEGDRLGPIVSSRKLTTQSLGSVGLGNNARLEIQTRRSRFYFLNRFLS